MVLPALALVAKPLSCSMADAHSCHRKFLTFLLAVFGLSYGSLGLLPFFKDTSNHKTDLAAWCIICILMTIGYVSCACIFCINDALASNYARKHNKSYAKMRIFANSGFGSGALLMLIVGEVSWLPFRVLGCAILSITIVVDILVIVLWPYPEDFEMFHDGSTREQRKLSIVGPNTVAFMASGYDANRKRSSLGRDVLAKMRSGRSKSLSGLPISDTGGAYKLQKKGSLFEVIVHHQFHHQEFDSPFAKTLASLQVHTLNGDGQKLKIATDQSDGLKLQSNQSKLTDAQTQTMGPPQKEYTNFQCQMILIRMIALKHKSFIKYIAMFTVFGMIQSMVWNYQLDFFRESLVRDEAEFEFVSALCMVSQMILGEILINLVATEMIRLFGVDANLSLAIISLGLRCFFYANLLPQLGVWFVLLPEALQGPSLGLYWVLQVEIGSNFALMVNEFMPELKRRQVVRDEEHERQLSGCLRATMIGLMSSSMEGLGVALGSLIGGILSAQFGYSIMWNSCAGLSFICGALFIIWELLMKLR